MPSRGIVAVWERPGYIQPSWALPLCGLSDRFRSAREGRRSVAKPAAWICYQGRVGSAPDLRAGTTARARRPKVKAASISPKSRRAMS